MIQLCPAFLIRCMNVLGIVFGFPLDRSSTVDKELVIYLHLSCFGTAKDYCMAYRVQGCCNWFTV